MTQRRSRAWRARSFAGHWALEIGHSLVIGHWSLVIISSLVAAPVNPVPLLHAHAHNDYEHEHPLFDALEHGFCSVEADIFLVDGQLLVAHDREKVSPARTLQALYLDPLRERARKNGGRVFPNGPDVTLLIDVKSDAEETYAALRKVLEKYADVLTTFRGQSIETNAITVILSGNRPRTTLAAESMRYAALDGRLPDLDTNPPLALVPWISDDWTKHFTWRGKGPIPAEDRKTLGDLVERAHRQGRRVRLWGTADTPEVWRELRQAGVDLINTDDLAGVQRFLRSGEAHE